MSVALIMAEIKAIVIIILLLFLYYYYYYYCYYCQVNLVVQPNVIIILLFLISALPLLLAVNFAVCGGKLNCHASDVGYY